MKPRIKTTHRRRWQAFARLAAQWANTAKNLLLKLPHERLGSLRIVGFRVKSVFSSRTGRKFVAPARFTCATRGGDPMERI
jgi:hypothetical protein